MKFTIFPIALVLSYVVGTLAQNNDIQRQNADDAEKLQRKFATFNKDTKCTANEIACVGKDFAQCTSTVVNGKTVDKFVTTPCSANLECVVLPLVLKRGTSVTCATKEEQKKRLDAARGKNNNNSTSTPSDSTPTSTPSDSTPTSTSDSTSTPTSTSSPPPSKPRQKKKLSPSKSNPTSTSNSTSTSTPTTTSEKKRATTPTTTSKSTPTDITQTRKLNADDAENLQKKFANFKPDQACKQGENACINDQFAQCSGTKFALQPCSAGLKCVVLPLVNSRGTSITCDTEQDRLARLREARGG